MPTESKDDLRNRVNEVEATVRGLIQELVDANDRIRELEERLDDDTGANKPIPSGNNGSTEDESSSETTTDTDSDPLEEEDDIIVA